MKVLAVIPARGGSKALPKKNILPLLGKPLIEYTVSCALKVKSIDRIIVSTDNEEIAQISKKAGAEIIKRPPELATDESSTEDCLIHVVKTLKQTGYVSDVILTLQPTSPLRSAAIVEKAISMLEGDSLFDSVVSVTENRKIFGKIKNGFFEVFTPNTPFRRQDRESLYYTNGAIYVTPINVLLERHNVLGDSVGIVIMDPEESIDIDTWLDFQLAELILKKKENKL